MKKRIISLVVSFAMLFTLSIPAFAADSVSCTDAPVLLNDGAYQMIEENGNLYFVPTIEDRMGGGIGRCHVDKKTFSYSMTRSEAQAALDATTIGDGMVKSLGTLLISCLSPVASLSVSLILNFLGGETAYVSSLKEFLRSDKDKAYFEFKTHCVNRGYMYGDPMYDYVIDSIKITY